MKNVLFGVLFVFIAFGAQAQRFDLGLKIGANFSNINSVDEIKFKNKTGLVAGAFLSIGTENFAVQPEILYSQQGAKTDLGDFNMDYVNVPIMAKFYLIPKLLNIQAGPQFGFLTHQSLKDQVKAKDFDLVGAVGAGLDLPLGFRADVRYNFGIDKITKEFGGKTGVLSIAVGYSFL